MSRDPQAIKALLRETLEDGRLTGSEKKALSRILDDLDLSPQALAVYRSLAFDVAREALADPTADHFVETPTRENAVRVLDWLEAVNRLLVPTTDEQTEFPVEVCFSPGPTPPHRIATAVRRCQRSLDICVFTLTDNRISDAIIDVSSRGLPVRIITDDEKAGDLGSDVDRFRAAGIPVRTDDSRHHMHHKFAIFDGRSLLTGSYNWTRSAAEHNEENFLITGDPRLLTPFAEVFEDLWNRFKT